MSVDREAIKHIILNFVSWKNCTNPKGAVTIERIDEILVRLNKAVDEIERQLK